MYNVKIQQLVHHMMSQVTQHLSTLTMEKAYRNIWVVERYVSS